MHSSSFVKISGIALVALMLVLGGMFNVQAGPLMQETPAATTAAPTEAATTAATVAETPAPTAAATEAPTVVATEAPTTAATLAATAAATKYPPCPGTFLDVGTPAPTEASTSAATAAATAPAEFTPGYLGIAAETVDRCGARVTQLIAGSPADQAGLKLGDVIVAVNGNVVPDRDALRAFVLNNTAGTRFEVVVKRGAEELTLNGTLGRRAAVNPPVAETPEATPAATVAQ